MKARPERATVLSAARLRRWLVKRPVVMTAEQLAELAMIIDDPAAWPVPLLPPTENAGVRCAELHGVVRAAQRRRQCLAVLGSAALVAGFWIAGPMIFAAYIAAMIGS